MVCAVRVSSESKNWKYTNTTAFSIIYTALPYRLSVMYDLVTKSTHVCCIINLLQNNNYSIAGQLVGCVFDVSSV